MPSIQKAMKESIEIKTQLSATISRYLIRFDVNPVELLQYNPSLGSKLLSDLDSILSDLHLVCCRIVQQVLGDERVLLAEQLRLNIRITHLPSVFQECHLPSVASALELTREDIAGNSHSYNGFVAISGRVSSVSLTWHAIYSQTFKCNNPRCNNRNYLHYTPLASHNRVIKRAEDDGFMETGTNATLLLIDLLCNHCNEEMPESVPDRVYSNSHARLYASFSGGWMLRESDDNDLVNTVALGENIQLIGRLSRGFPKETRYHYSHGIQFEANNVLHEPDRRQETIPDAIAKVIYNGVVPKHVYRKLKLALLLSAVSISDDGDNKATRNTCIRPSVHVLVIKNSFDTVVPALMASMATLRRSVYWDHGTDATRQSLYNVCQPSSTSPGYLQASLLGRAKDGILMFEMDHLDKKSLAHVAPILSAKDGSEVYIQCEDAVQEQGLICCCWPTYTIIDPGMSYHIHGEEPEAGGFLIGPACRVEMIEAFDIVVLQSEPVEVSGVTRAVAIHTTQSLVRDTLGSPSQSLSAEELSQYIRLASRKDVRYTEFR
ncbi:hypothetical protein B0O80DRAFT_524586, partial [Mortierella sp. GBAus27b]